MKFKELEIGQRFRYNCMVFVKQKPQMQERENRNKIMSNAKFLSDDHYESERTDIYVGGNRPMFEKYLDVEPIDTPTRAEKNEKVAV